jgi:hypothetical protein
MPCDIYPTVWDDIDRYKLHHLDAYPTKFQLVLSDQLWRICPNIAE